MLKNQRIANGELRRAASSGGGELLTRLKAEARTRGCDAVHLDTGYQRHAAYRVYLENGFQLNRHHLACELKNPNA
jgi:hypothetical protein